MRQPAQVVGDGRSSMAKLIERRQSGPASQPGPWHGGELYLHRRYRFGIAGRARVDPRFGLPEEGVKILIRRNANLSTGGTATDVTELVHEEAAAQAVDAARAVGLDVAGVDVVAEDISRPLGEQGGGVVEVNAGPGVANAPGAVRRATTGCGAMIVDSLFPAGANGRIPVVAITGSNGKTTTTRMLTHVLRTAGSFVGMACTDGIYLNGRRIDNHDCSGPADRRVLLDPRCRPPCSRQLAAASCARGWALINARLRLSPTLAKAITSACEASTPSMSSRKVKEVMVRTVAPDGWAVLNAGDPLVAGMAASCPGQVLFFHGDEGQETLSKHRAGGGRVVTTRRGGILLCDKASETALLPLTEIPCTRGGLVPFQVENVLAATAAAWSLNLSPEAIREGLRSFRQSPQEVPGRFNVLLDGDAAIIVDYAHNPSAVSALSPPWRPSRNRSGPWSSRAATAGTATSLKSERPPAILSTESSCTPIEVDMIAETENSTRCCSKGFVWASASPVWRKPSASTAPWSWHGHVASG